MILILLCKTKQYSVENKDFIPNLPYILEYSFYKKKLINIEIIFFKLKTRRKYLFWDKIGKMVFFVTFFTFFDILQTVRVFNDWTAILPLHVIQKLAIFIVISAKYFENIFIKFINLALPYCTAKIPFIIAGIKL